MESFRLDVSGFTYKKHVGQDTAEHTGLNNTDLVRLQRNNRDLQRLDP